MSDEGMLARNLDGTALDAALADARRHTLKILADFDSARWQVPELAIINPPLWELGHLGWFAEWWILRGAGPDGRGGTAARHDSILQDADRWFDSSRVAHAMRWQLNLPPVSAVYDYVGAVLDGVRNRLARASDGPQDLNRYRLALFHEDMHGEALTYMRQTLSNCPPPFLPAALEAIDEAAGEVEIVGGSFSMGLKQGDGFAFDNEMTLHQVDIAPFAIDRECVSNRAFADFVGAGGYRDPQYWSRDGWARLQRTGNTHPQYWRKAAEGRAGGWEQLWFGQWQSLPLEAPVCHITAHEAEAFCAWSGRRLPTEPEWEYAAVSSAIRYGRSVWEWLADPFAPYPGFTPGIYQEYSAPWFHTHRCVRGASFATRPRMRHARYRNFYTPDRDDIFVGFRTCRA
jgi:ergothioneine biosynthesis protein EgtB